MRHFLFIALGMGMLLPTGANAETHWLLVKGKAYKAGAYSWQMPTDTRAECETAKSKVISSSSWDGKNPILLGAICLPGK